MRRFSRVPFILIMALLLLASCGKQYEAKGLVKDFVKANATKEINIDSFTDLDSTRVISDSVIMALRENVKTDPMFKKGTQLTADRKSQTLLYIRMRYLEDSLELSRTFYFNPELDGIVAIK